MGKEIEFLKKQNQELQNQLNHQSNNSVTKTEERYAKKYNISIEQEKQLKI